MLEGIFSRKKGKKEKGSARKVKGGFRRLDSNVKGDSPSPGLKDIDVSPLFPKKQRGLRRGFSDLMHDPLNDQTAVNIDIDDYFFGEMPQTIPEKAAQSPGNSKKS